MITLHFCLRLDNLFILIECGQEMLFESIKSKKIKEMKKMRKMQMKMSANLSLNEEPINHHVVPFVNFMTLLTT